MTNREIKFKAFCHLSNHWFHDFQMNSDGTKIYENGDVYKVRSNEYDTGEITLCQSTGLKDSAGVEIYEGDIVTEEVCDFVISFKFGTFLVGSTPIWNFAKNKDLKIIGNIYQHPNLLNNQTK